MPTVRYTAKRSFTGGAVLNDTIVLGLNVREPMSRSRAADRTLQQAKSGRTQAVYFRGADSWQIQTLTYVGDLRLPIVMWLDSVEDGQVFEFAPYDAPTDSPIDYRNVVCVGGSYIETHEISTGAYATDHFSYQTALLEVP